MAPTPHSTAPHRLHRRFIAALLVVATAVALAVASATFALVQRKALDDGRGAIEGLVEALGKTAAVGVYAQDAVLLQEVVDGMARHPLVAGVTVFDAHGKPLLQRHAGGAAAARAAERAGMRVDASLRSPFDAKEVLGRLQVDADTPRIRADAQRTALFIGAAMAGLTLLLAAVLNVLVLRFLSRPLTDLAAQLAELEPGSAGRLRVAQRHADDELGFVVAAANRLLDATEDSLKRERTMRAEIAAMEAQYRQIFDFTSAGIFVVTTGGRLINSNPTVSRILGADAADMTELRHADFIARVFVDAPRVREMVHTATVEGETVSADLELRRLDGATRWVHCLISVQADAAAADGQRLVEGVVYDVTQRLHAESAARYAAEHDALTGLKNRAATEQALTQLIVTARQTTRAVTVLYIDLDGFKLVNDEHGHAAGDVVLVECAQRLRALLRRTSDFVGRIGGDEMVMVLPDATSTDELVSELARRIPLALSAPVALDGTGTVAQVGASVGVASFPRHALTSAALLRAADRAMYAVKHAGKNGAHFASSEFAEV